MKGYLIGIVGEDIDDIYLFPLPIEEEYVRTAYLNWDNKDNTFEEFEDYWNHFNPEVIIERVFITEIYIQ